MAVPRMTPVPMVPRIALPNPHIRKPSLATNVSNHDSLRNSTFDTSYPVPTIPVRHHQDSISSDIGQAVGEYSPLDGTPRFVPPPPPRPSSTTQKHNSKLTPRSSHFSPQSKSNDSGYLSSSSPETSKSPVVPIRSMFPMYNPSVSLQEQHYYPQRPLPTRQGSSYSSRTAHYDLPPSAATPTGRPMGTPLGAPNVIDFQTELPSPPVSQPLQLNELWEATHGMEPNPRIKSYDLELARTEEANFTLGSDPSTPFYSMITYDTNEFALTKICPRKQSLRCDVSVNSIEPPSRRMPPNDGLVTFIFPKMAAMLAINQSSALAQEHGLAPTHRDEIQATAVKRAADQEACRLRWNSHAQHYEIEHPAVGRRTRCPEFVKSPESAVDTSRMFSARPVLEVIVSTPRGKSLPVISVANPGASDAESSAPSISGIKMSTMPQTDSSETLVTLDFNTRILRINANQILEHVPSLFAVDSIVSAVMTVAIADSATNPVMAAMEIWQPKPSRAMSTYGGSVTGKSTTGSVFYATVAEREEAEEEARELADTHMRDIKNKERRKQHKGWFGNGKKNGNGRKESKGKTKKVVTKEFDLEKLGHYQSGNRRGQKLPSPVRFILTIMIGGLKFVVWFLTAIVQFLAWILVSCTRGVTSEKF